MTVGVALASIDIEAHAPHRVVPHRHRLLRVQEGEPAARVLPQRGGISQRARRIVGEIDGAHNAAEWVAARGHDIGPRRGGTTSTGTREMRRVFSATEPRKK